MFEEALRQLQAQILCSADTTATSAAAEPM